MYTRPSPRFVLVLLILPTALGACFANAGPVLAPDADPERSTPEVDNRTNTPSIASALPYAPAAGVDPTRHDTDGDGAVDAVDPCPDFTVPRSTALVRGCAPLDILQRPESIFAEHERELADLRDAAAGSREYDTLSRTLEDALHLFGLAGDSLRNGHSCDAQASIARVESLVRSASREGGTRAGEVVRGEGVELNRPTIFGRYLEQNLSAAANALARLTPILDRLCTITRPDTVTRGRIVREDIAARRFHLDTGAIVALSADFQSDLSADLVPGAFVAFATVSLSDSRTLGKGIEVLVPLPAGVAPVIIDDCQELRLRPMQPESAEQFGLPLEGYRVGANLEVEYGMHIASEEVDCEGPITIRRSMHIELTYRKLSTDSVSTTLLASNLEAGTKYGLGFPYDRDPAYPSKLTVTRRWQACEGGPESRGECTAPQTFAVETLGLYVRNSFSFCKVEYDRTALNVDKPGSYETVQVVGVDVEAMLDPGTNAIFMARAWPAPGGVSVRPKIDTITRNEPFAVYDRFDDICASGIWLQEVCGTKRFAGLLWPVVAGVRNSSFFRYSCEVPQLSLDVVDHCGSGQESFYVLPIHKSGPLSPAKVSFGNNTSSHVAPWTHCWDVPLPIGTPVYAARRGEVINVVESLSMTCGNCSNNLVQIRHEDDTIAEYLHFRTNGVAVELHEFVQRGQLIGYSGNIGRSTGPHLHWAVLRPDTQATVPSLYRVYLAPGFLGPGFLKKCYAPNTGDRLFYAPD